MSIIKQAAALRQAVVDGNLTEAEARQALASAIIGCPECGRGWSRMGARHAQGCRTAAGLPALTPEYRAQVAAALAAVPAETLATYREWANSGRFPSEPQRRARAAIKKAASAHGVAAMDLLEAAHI